MLSKKIETVTMKIDKESSSGVFQILVEIEEMTFGIWIASCDKRDE